MATVPIPQGATIDDQPSTVPIPQGAAIDASPGSQSSEDEASQTRQMLVSGLTGQPTPNMTEADKQSFARGKAAGAVSVPVIAGATIGATGAASALQAIPGATEAILTHLEESAAEYAAKYPHLLALAGKLGIPTTLGGVLLYLAKDKK